MLLWTGGIESSVFEKLMADALEATISGMQTFGGAAKQLITNRLGRPFRLANTFDKLSRLGLEPDQPGVRTVGLHKLMNAGLYHIKIGLKHKARIPVPKSYTLVGVCDEDKYLRPKAIYGRCFTMSWVDRVAHIVGIACVQHFDHKTGKTDRIYLAGRMLVTRSPVIHPGDAQVLWGIGEPPADSPFAGEGNHLPNCVVFSSCGPKPVPNMLGGGDLGKQFLVYMQPIANVKLLDGVRIMYLAKFWFAC
jgi:RNA-dependent RNA polymerase